MFKTANSLIIAIFCLSAPTAMAQAMHFANLPVGLELPISVKQMRPDTAGEQVTAATERTVKLPSGDSIPAGTKVFGRTLVVNGERRYLFDTLRLSDGTTFPISAVVTERNHKFVLQLKAPAQVAVTGTML